MIKKFIVYGLWSIIIAIFSCSSYTTYLIPYAFAIESSSSASPSADLKTKLQNLQQEIASRAANLKNEVNKKLFNKAYFGILISKSGDYLNIQLRDQNGKIRLTEDTIFQIKDKILKKNEGLEALSANDYFVSLGDVDDNDILTAKKVIKLATPSAVPKKVIYGEVKNIASGTVTLKNIEGSEFKIVFDKKTVFEMGKDSATLTDIKMNRKIIALTYEQDSKNDTYLSKYIYILPYSITIKPKTITPSAQVTRGVTKQN